MPPVAPDPSAPAPGLAGPARPRVLVLVAHPQMEQSRVNRALMVAAASAPSSAEVAAGCADVQVRDLYALYPDYLVDVDAERAAAAAADLIVWQHPIHWYGMTPMLKLWADDVLGFGWAYGPGGTALRGRALWVVATTGGPADSYRPDGYNRHPFDAFVPPYEQTAALCGLRFLPPWVIHGAHRLDAAAIDRLAAGYAARLQNYPRGFGPAVEPAADEVPRDSRPPPDATAR